MVIGQIDDSEVLPGREIRQRPRQVVELKVEERQVL